MNRLHHHTDETDPAKLLQELDRDSKSRSLTGGWKTAMTVLFVLYSVTMIVMALVVSGATQYTRLPVFVGMTLFVGYLKYPASKRDALRDNYFPWYDVLLAFASLIVFFYYAVMQKKIIQMANRIGTTQIIIGIIGILLAVFAVIPVGALSLGDKIALTNPDNFFGFTVSLGNLGGLVFFAVLLFSVYYFARKGEKASRG